MITSPLHKFLKNKRELSEEFGIKWRLLTFILWFLDILTYCFIIIGIGVIVWGILYISLLSFSISKTSFPYINISDSGTINANSVLGFNIILAISGITTIFGVFLAYWELKKFNLEKKSYLPLLKIDTVQKWINEKEKAGGYASTFKLYKVNLSSAWSKKVFDILPKENAHPIFVIQNMGKGSASRVKVELCTEVQHRGNKYEYNFSTRNKKNIAIEPEVYSFGPKESLILTKGECNNFIDYSKNFAIRLTYYSDYTKEWLKETFEAVVYNFQIPGPRKKQISYITYVHLLASN